jgi:TRAP-type C4-dicarboxylate transport system substrate-binding protein
MKKRNVITSLWVFALAIVLLALCSCAKKETASTSSAKTYKWKMGTAFSDPAVRVEDNAWGVSMKTFIDSVKEKTNGRIIIEPFYASVLGGQPEMFEQLRRGELEVFFGQPMASVDPRFGAFNTPFLFKDYDEVEKLIASPDAPLFKLSQKWLEENKAYLICTGTSMFRGLFNTKHRVAKIKDVRDLKLRIYEDPIVSIFWKDICNASSIAMSEIRTSLQTKIVDGLEYPVSGILTAKYYELGKYFSDLNWQWAWNINFIISKKYWDELPDDLKKIVTQCGWDAMKVFTAENAKTDNKIENILVGFGMDYYHLSAEDRDDWVKYARSLDGKLRETIGGDTFDAIMNAIKSL